MHLLDRRSWVQGDQHDKVFQERDFRPGVETEGGEALPVAAVLPTRSSHEPLIQREVGVLGAERWYALWTRSNCERLVSDQLTTKGFHAFLPTTEVWSRRGDVRRRIRVPLFPGYLFLRHAMDKTSYIEVRKARGLVCLLGERWDRLAEVPDREIAAFQTLQRAHLPVLAHGFLREGQRVRVTRGPLAEVEGILVRQNPRTGLLVLSVNLLQRSVAVEIDCTWAVPA